MPKTESVGEGPVTAPNAAMIRTVAWRCILGRMRELLGVLGITFGNPARELNAAMKFTLSCNHLR
jgi:hypothetical protein